MNKALILLSGGQDSTTCLYWAKKKFDSIYNLSNKMKIEKIDTIKITQGVSPLVYLLKFSLENPGKSVHLEDIAIETKKLFPSFFGWSKYKDHIDYARSKIPELNNTIDAIEEEIQIRKAKLKDVKDELVEVGLLPSNNKAVLTAEEKINELEKIATDLIVKRADLYLNYRTSSLDFDGLDSEE